MDPAQQRGRSVHGRPGLLLGLTLPITQVQILWVNMITAVTPGVALAFEPSEQDTMAREPRPRGEPLLPGDLIWHIVLVGVPLFVIIELDKHLRLQSTAGAGKSAIPRVPC